ncbi:MAG TPA: hypothetical protein VN381_02690, partial [Anaerovoracaceae bacterium]|nr:hypothetical protein [Anaerovoracaceae bacterium]
MIAFAFIISLYSVAFSLNSDKNWEKVSDDLYKNIHFGGEAVLVREMQDRDITDQKSIDALFEKKASTAILDDKNLNTKASSKFDITIENLSGKISIGMQKIAVDGQNLAIPQSVRYLPCGYEISDDGSLSVFSTEIGFWILDSKGDPVKASLNYFDRKTYAQLSDTFSKYHEGGNIFWNEQIKISPDSSKAAYVSNKDCAESKGQSLFLFDLKRNREAILAKSSNGEEYIMRGWLNSSYMLCEKWSDGPNEFYAVSVNGDKVLLDIETERQPYILDTKDNYMAYLLDGMGGNQIRIEKFDAVDLTLDQVQEMKLNGHSVNLGKFSDDCSYFGTTWSPGYGKEEQYLKLISLSSGEEINIDRLPKGVGGNIITDFSFLNGDKLLINIADATGKMLIESTWIYSLNGGE